MIEFLNCQKNSTFGKITLSQYFFLLTGKSGFNIAEKEVEKHIFGFTVAHDITARDWIRKNGGQVLLGKSMDSFCPLGTL